MQIGITGEGLLDPARLQAWSRELQVQINRQVKAGMSAAMPAAKAALRNEVSTKLSLRKAGFANVMRGQVSSKDEQRLPLAVFYSKAGWLGAHVQGANITGRSGKGILIPVNIAGGKTRIGYRAFQRSIKALDAQGNLHFVKVKSGNVLVYAETAKTGSALNRHNKRVGKDKGGRKRSVEIPIAVFVPSVKLKRRLDFDALAKRISGDMAASVQAKLDT